jgi:hypothetical protein
MVMRDGKGVEDDGVMELSTLKRGDPNNVRDHLRLGTLVTRRVSILD